MADDALSAADRVLVGVGALLGFYLFVWLLSVVSPLILGLMLLGGAMFGLGFLTSLWITFGAVWVKAEPTYWTTTVGTTATSRTFDGDWGHRDIGNE